MKNVIYAIANRNGKALLLNGSTNKYTMLDGENSQKATLKAICTIVGAIGDSKDMNTATTIILPKNLAFILRKELVYEWINNGNKTAKGTELDDEFIELCKYISDMRNYLGYRVKVKMTGTAITTADEELVMKNAWNLLDKATNYKPAKANKATNAPVMPSKPAFMCK